MRTLGDMTKNMLNPNWHEAGHFPPLVLFGTDFVSWIFTRNFQTFLEVKIDINWNNLTPCQVNCVLKKMPLGYIIGVKWILKNPLIQNVFHFYKKQWKEYYDDSWWIHHIASQILKPRFYYFYINWVSLYFINCKCE